MKNGVYTGLHGQFRSYGTRMNLICCRLRKRGMTSDDFERLHHRYQALWNAATSIREQKRYRHRATYWLSVWLCSLPELVLRDRDNTPAGVTVFHYHPPSCWNRPLPPGQGRRALHEYHVQAHYAHARRDDRPG